VGYGMIMKREEWYDPSFGNVIQYIRVHRAPEKLMVGPKREKQLIKLK
jgi:hypothetical protein